MEGKPDFDISTLHTIYRWKVLEICYKKINFVSDMIISTWMQLVYMSEEDEYEKKQVSKKSFDFFSKNSVSLKRTRIWS